MTDVPIPSTPWGLLNAPYGFGSQRVIPGLSNTAAYNEWLSQVQRYRDWWGWIDRRKLDQTDTTAQVQPAWIFPLKINVPAAVAEKHANALFGEADGENTNSIVGINFVDANNKHTPECDVAADFVANVLRDSNAGTLFHQAGFTSQILGGAVFKVAFSPQVSALSPNPIRIQPILPDFFIPIYDPANPLDLLEAHVIYDISKEDALARFGVETDERLVQFHEHWTRDKYKIEIGGTILQATMEKVSVDMEGPNPFGFVPFIYVPHYIRLGGFYGQSHVPSLEGITMELNSAMADRGDNVKQASGNEYWMANVSAQVRTRKLSEKFPAVVDLGTNSLSKEGPQLERFETGTLSDGMSGYTEELWNLIEKMGSVPSVIWGADEGSQRSSLTLAFRTWALTSHIKKERAQWTAALMTMAKMILIIGARKGKGVSAKMLTLMPVVDWTDIMPRDRMEQVNEMILRVANHTASIKHAVRSLSVGEDINEHLDEITKDMITLMKLEAAGKPQNGTSGVSPKANETMSRDLKG